METGAARLRAYVNSGNGPVPVSRREAPGGRRGRSRSSRAYGPSPRRSARPSGPTEGARPTPQGADPAPPGRARANPYRPIFQPSFES